MKKRIRENHAGRIADLIAMIITAAAVLAVVLTLCGNRIYIIRSGSMEPAIRTGSAVLVNEKTEMEKIRPGDIICFQAPNGVPVIHRAVAVTADGITTKGDANQTADSNAVDRGVFTGKVIFSVPFAGYAAGFLASARGKILLLTALVITLILWAFKKSSRRALAGMLAVSVLALGSVSGGYTTLAADLGKGSVTESGSAETTAEETDVSSGESREDADEDTADPETGENEENTDHPENDPAGEDPSDPKSGSEESVTDGTGDGSGQGTPEEPGGEEGESVSEGSGEDPGGDPGNSPEDEDPADDESAQDPEDPSDDPEDEDPADESQTESEEEPAPEEEEETAEAPVLRAATEYSVTVRYRANDGTISRNASAKVQYAVGTDIGKNNTLIYRSADYGSTWELLKTKVTPSDTSANLTDVSAIGLKMTGYSVTNATAYNLRADQTGTVFCQNGSATNAVTTKRLNGGTEITQDMTVDLYVNWQTRLILDANGGAVWGDPSATTADGGTIFYGKTYNLINRFSKSNSTADENYIQPVPNFCRDGYIFDGWNTDRSNVPAYGQSSATQYGRGGKTSFRRLKSDGTGGSGTTVLYAQWIRREGISGAETLSNGAVISNEDSFGHSSIKGLELMIPFSVSEEKAADYSAASDANGFFWQENGGKGRFYYMNGISSPTAPVQVPGTVSLRLNNRAYDNAGKYYDVLITVSNIVIMPKADGIYASYEPGGIYILDYDLFSGVLTAMIYGEKHVGASYDISIRILEHAADNEITGKKVLMYFQDLDIPDITTMNPKYRYVMNGSGIAPYAESITVPTEISMEFYTKAGENSVIAKEENGATRITGGERTGSHSADYGQITPNGASAYQGIPMSEAEYTAVAFPVMSGNIRFSWSGSYCGTQLFASPPSGSVRILKYSLDETVTDGNGGYDLSGAGFGIYSNEAQAEEAAENGAVTGEELAVLITDGSGETPFSQGLTLGTYYIAEICPPHGYERDTQIREIRIEAAGQKEQVTVGNRPLLAQTGILLRKTDANGDPIRPVCEQNLAGAVFSLDYYRTVTADADFLKDLPPDRHWEARTNQSGAVDLSDENCAVSGDSLYYESDSGRCALPAGTLVIAETKAPPGFERNEEIYILTVEFDAEGNAVRTLYDEEGNLLGDEMRIPGEPSDIALKIKEPLSYIDLTIEKQVNIEDLLTEHGEADFAFEVTGSDLTGTDHIFHQLIRFAKAEEGEGILSDSVTVRIPAGTYRITESATDRFALVAIEAGSRNLSVTTQNAGDPIGTIQPVSGYASGTLTEDASVVFRNRKTDWGGFSHASAVINHIGD